MSHAPFIIGSYAAFGVTCLYLVFSTVLRHRRASARLAQTDPRRRATAGEDAP